MPANSRASILPRIGMYGPNLLSFSGKLQSITKHLPNALAVAEELISFGPSQDAPPAAVAKSRLPTSPSSATASDADSAATPNLECLQTAHGHRSQHRTKTWPPL